MTEYSDRILDEVEPAIEEILKSSKNERGFLEETLRDVERAAEDLSNQSLYIEITSANFSKCLEGYAILLFPKLLGSKENVNKALQVGKVYRGGRSRYGTYVLNINGVPVYAGVDHVRVVTPLEMLSRA